MATTEPHADTRPLLHHSTGRDRGDGYISFHEYRRAQRFRIADLFYTD